MEFTIQHFIALAPLLITSLTVVVVMLAIAVIHGALTKLPIRIRNSPTKLPVPGKPREAAAKNRLIAGR